MSVRVNKSSFSIREKLSELERPIGVKGNELMRAETAQEARDLVSAGRKNIIINGDMRIAQRGTTSTVDNNYGCVDRWFKYSNGDTSTWGQATDPVHGTYAYWVAKSNGYGNLRQRIEPFFVPTEGLNYTASFWMKISSGTAPLRYEMYNNTNNTDIKSNMNHDTLTTEWKKYIINFRLDSSDSMDNWHLMLGSNGAPANVTFYLTKCQIERGDIATDFEHRSYGEELALCQRYYERFSADCGNGGFATLMIASKNNNTIIVGQPIFRVPKRAVGATFSHGGNLRMHNATTGSDITISSVQNSQLGTHGGYIVLIINSISISNGDGFRVEGRNDTSAYIAFSSEL